MSYCRWFSGDVYMFGSVGGGIVCCGCFLNDPGPNGFSPSEEFDTRTAALEHLQAHRDAGHSVPEFAFERLREEIEEEGDDCVDKGDD